MKRIVWLGLAFLFLTVLSGFLTYQTQSVRTGTNQTSKEYSGYLVCRDCARAKSGIAMDGASVLTNPENHTVACLKMQTCVSSGYGLFIKSGDGRYTYYPFDKQGSEQAYQKIVCKTSKTDHVSVTVTGAIQNGVLIIKTIAEK